jgi:hypothetical protein
MIVCNVDGGLIVAKYGSIGKWHIKFFEGIR